MDRSDQKRVAQLRLTNGGVDRVGVMLAATLLSGSAQVRVTCSDGRAKHATRDLAPASEMRA